MIHHVLSFVFMMLEMLALGFALGTGWVLAHEGLARLFSFLDRRMLPDGPAPAFVILADGTKFPVDEIPRTRDGSVDPAWLDEHCDCGKPHGEPIVSTGTGGLYL